MDFNVSTKTELIPFGKYKDQPVTVLQNDQGYTEWLLSQDWFRERYGGIHTLIINNFSTDHDTPDHNAKQARFLNDDFCLALSEVIQPEWTKNARDHIARYDGVEFSNAISMIEEREFEVGGFDVFFRPVLKSLSKKKARFGHEFYPTASWTSVYVEIKPTVSDNFPSVLRQIKSQIKRAGGGAIVLFVSSYTGVGANLSDMKAIFKSSGIHVVFEHEVEKKLEEMWEF